MVRVSGRKHPSRPLHMLRSVGNTKESPLRTNIESDDDLMRRAVEMSGLSTKRATVEEALRVFVRACAARRLLELAGKAEFYDDYDPLDDADVPEPPR